MARFSVREIEDEPSSSQPRPAKIPRFGPLPSRPPPPPAPRPPSPPSPPQDPQRSPPLALSSDSEADEEENNDDHYEDEEEEEEEEEERLESEDEVYDRSREDAESNGDEDDEERGGDEHGQEEAVFQQEIETSNRNTEESVDAILTDPDVFDCNVCLEPLCAPIFQCENGHIACASCCGKIKNKCHMCSWPIGYNRCRAIEKVLESVKVKCQYVKYGCQTFLRYDKKQDHEKQCDFAPCSCPFPNCSFVGSVVQLSQHFSDKHSAYRSVFKLNILGDFYLKDDTKFHVLQGQPENFLFVLTNRNVLLGNVITISRMGPALLQNYLYSLSVKHQDTILKFQTYTTAVRQIVTTPTQRIGYSPAPQTPFLLVPKEFFSGDRGLKISFCIFNRPKAS